MITFLKNLFRKKVVLPPPSRYPEQNNVHEWMEEKVRYFEVMRPELMHTLFDPTWGDYLPLTIHVATSLETFRTDHIEKYREIRDRYPQHRPDKNRTHPRNSMWTYYPAGPEEDYPEY